MTCNTVRHGAIAVVLGVAGGCLGQLTIIENAQQITKISADGRYVIGSGTAASPGAFRLDLTTGDRILLGLGVPEDITPNGMTVIGSNSGGAFLWTASGGYIDLDVATPAFGLRDSGKALSDTGLVLLGDDFGPGAFRHQLGGATASLEDAGDVNDISGDGQFSVGYLRYVERPGSPPVPWAARWDATGAPVLIAETGEATSISADGRFVTGRAGDEGEGFRWSADRGLEPLDMIPGGIQPLPWGISTDGSRIAGTVLVLPDTRAFVWDEGGLVRSLKDFLQNEHSMMVDGWDFRTIDTMSDDGRSFGGRAINPSGQTVAYVVRVGVECHADLDGDGELTIFDFVEFQNLFATGDLQADFDGDGALTLFDFLEFQTLFALGCA